MRELLACRPPHPRRSAGVTRVLPLLDPRRPARRRRLLAEAGDRSPPATHGRAKRPRPPSLRRPRRRRRPRPSPRPRRRGRGAERRRPPTTRTPTPPVPEGYEARRAARRRAAHRASRRRAGARPRARLRRRDRDEPRRHRRRPLPGRDPVTVNNFVFLALHRYYDGIVFHRVLEDFMAQTGDPTGTGTGGPATVRRRDRPGLATTRAACSRWRTPDPARTARSSSSPSLATPWLDGNHTVFGRVIDGDEVLDALTRIDPTSQTRRRRRCSTPSATLREQGVALEGEGTRPGGARARARAPSPSRASLRGRRLPRRDRHRSRARRRPASSPSPTVMERVTIVTRPR
jgi:cyclophilin family peptidyl-prolyl cis-trans isomerase